MENKRISRSVALFEQGKLEERARCLHERLACCDLCSHRCGVNRLKGELGRCGIGAKIRIASACAHNGEEPVLSGSRGSGTVFAAGCNLRCLYCQNHQISQGQVSVFPELTAQELALEFLRLQREGCHNVNWVSPSHVVPQFVSALVMAIQQGFRLPVVYNTNGYDSLETLALLDGVVDIYLPDFKYADESVAKRLSGISAYPENALASIREMFRQVGDLVLDENDIALSGVIVRHLVLPCGLSGTREVLSRLAVEVSRSLTVSLMAQYYPDYRADTVEELRRTVSAEEYQDALEAFENSGLENGWSQELSEAPECYRPDFTRKHPFGSPER